MEKSFMTYQRETEERNQKSEEERWKKEIELEEERISRARDEDDEAIGPDASVKQQLPQAI